MEVAREVGTRWRASQLRVPVKIIGVRLIACSCSTCKQTDMVSLSTFIPMFDEMGTNMTGSSYSRQPLGLWAGFMLVHNHSVFSVFLLGPAARLLTLIKINLIFYVLLLCYLPFPPNIKRQGSSMWLILSSTSFILSCMHSFRGG